MRLEGRGRVVELGSVLRACFMAVGVASEFRGFFVCSRELAKD